MKRKEAERLSKWGQKYVCVCVCLCAGRSEALFRFKQVKKMAFICPCRVFAAEYSVCISALCVSLSVQLLYPWLQQVYKRSPNSVGDWNWTADSQSHKLSFNTISSKCHVCAWVSVLPSSPRVPFNPNWPKRWPANLCYSWTQTTATMEATQPEKFVDKTMWLILLQTVKVNQYVDCPSVYLTEGLTVDKKEERKTSE